MPRARKTPDPETVLDEIERRVHGERMLALAEGRRIHERAMGEHAAAIVLIDEAAAAHMAAMDEINRRAAARAKVSATHPKGA